MDVLQSFLEWAWARHHNLLSWYVRPLFLIPFCCFAYRRSGSGIGVTLAGLLTSMFWFPAPSNPSPEVLAALEAERNYLTGDWTVAKILIAALIPATFAALGAAFWRRSFVFGAVVLNGMALIKVVWTSFYFDHGSFVAHLLPALIGLGICDFFLVAWFWRRRCKMKTAEPGGGG
jgi:hypothetical protein